MSDALLQLSPSSVVAHAALAVFLVVGDPVRGGLALAVLGAGTFPSPFAHGTALGSLSAARRAQLHRVLGVAFVAMGYVLLSHGLTLFGFHVPHVPLPYYQPLTGP